MWLVNTGRVALHVIAGNTISPAALAATSMMTVLGPVRFVSYGNKVNQNRLETYVVQWIDGKQEIIWPASYGSTDFVYPVDWIRERK